jgi:hypothetical protein
MPSGIFTLKQQNLAVEQGAWVNQKPLAVDYLVVAGGGGGGYIGGGGGAGGLLQGNIGVNQGSSITVTIGGGGNGGTGGGAGANGSNSVFGAIASTGGGYGGAYPVTVGASGGSGGGGNTFESGNVNGPGQGTAGQGNAGGTAAPPNGANYQAGGGGGSGTVGLNAVPGSAAGNGGAGAASNISGTSTTYAGGGGGAADSGGAAANGGVGGGGAGGASRGATGGSGSVSGANGTANTGGGGGGYGVGGAGGNGGSGIVILSYPDNYAAAASTTGSPTVGTSGSGSLYFDGSDNLNAPSNSAFTYGTGDFCIECWCYFTAGVGGGGYSYVFGQGADAGATSLGLYIEGGVYKVWAGSNVITGTTAFAQNTWVHLAVTRSGTTMRLFVNGVQNGSATNSNSIATGTAIGISIGRWAEIDNNYITGYVSNFRVVKGSAVYTSAFTPSTTPLRAITNTQLLVSAVSGSQFADSSTNSFTLTRSGDVAWNQLSPFATGLGYKNRVYTWTSSGSITF